MNKNPTMLVYDVWIDDVYVGRYAEAWGQRARIDDCRVRCQLAVVQDEDSKWGLVSV